MKQLKPCPFCKGVNLNLNCDDRRLMCDTVECNGCGALVPSSEWNTRVDGWISVEDRLPDIGVLVFVCTSVFGNVVDIDNICDHGGWLRFAYLHDKTKSKVTHWMPLPSLPAK